MLYRNHSKGWYFLRYNYLIYPSINYKLIFQAKAVKGQKPDMKQIIEEFEAKIEVHRKQSQEQEETMQKATEAAQKTKKSSKSSKCRSTCLNI
jgi:hypothetical protein